MYKRQEYERLAYLDGKVEAATTNPVVDDFFIIANSYLNKTNIKGCFNSAGNQEIAKIISDTYDAIKAAKTTADQTAACLLYTSNIAIIFRRQQIRPKYLRLTDSDTPIFSS